MDGSMLDVREFHDAIDDPTPTEPVSLVHRRQTSYDLDSLATSLELLATQAHEAARMQDGDNLLLRCHLMIEELGECVRAMHQGDMVEVLDALCDMRYVNDGTALSLGLGPVFMPAFREVHAANMSKFDDDGRPIKDAIGRMTKGPNYRPPNLRLILKGAGR